jgi:metallophosphoesterase (TIGR00282 family)
VIRLLFIGDVVGAPGRGLVRGLLRPFREERGVDFVVANGENAAGGRGLTPAVAAELFAAGVDVLTSGNHIWKNREILSVIDKEPRILRPANYPDDPQIPGHGCDVYQVASVGCRIGVLNLQGRVFMDPIECPFRVGHELVEQMRHETPLILVDFHAEATSEKYALLWHLDGQVTAVIGTHTHVPTADEMVTPSGTAYQSDAGMTGPFDGVLGVRKDVILHGMITHLPVRHELAEGDLRLCGLLIEADASSGRARNVERVCLRKRMKDEV